MIVLALVIFGLIYAGGVALLRWFYPNHGWTSILVVFGVFAVVVGFAAWHGVELAVDLFICFAAAGTPMILGDLASNAVAARKASQADAEAIRRGASGHPA